jgi:hypothetical protein
MAGGSRAAAAPADGAVAAIKTKKLKLRIERAALGRAAGI